MATYIERSIRLFYLLQYSCILFACFVSRIKFPFLYPSQTYLIEIFFLFFESTYRPHNTILFFYLPGRYLNHLQLFLLLQNFLQIPLLRLLIRICLILELDSPLTLALLLIYPQKHALRLLIYLLLNLHIYYLKLLPHQLPIRKLQSPWQSFPSPDLFHILPQRNFFVRHLRNSFVIC